ncbi:MAG: Sulfate-transporting ATPase [Bacteroidetes bacterium]|nr:Sulfate-transporting ATPase [Bacteroidota bacterium]
MNTIETTNLVHAFSEKEIALQGINMQVPEGAIYGFLGPNGAGKTTTLRLLLGLLKKQQGTISFFGKPFEQNRIATLQKVGSLIESPSIYAHLTATENLAVLQKIYQCPKQRIAEVLELVGLSGTGKKKAGKFSLGMKQRLSIAIAMLNDPSILILDEPTNGLDPNGIIEMRELLKRLNQEKKITILISSHLLSEIEKLVTHVGIIHKGNMMFQGTLPELISKQQQTSHLSIGTSDNGRALSIINDQQLNAKITAEKIILPLLPKEKIVQMNELLVKNNIGVFEITTVKNDLETIFMDLIK